MAAASACGGDGAGNTALTEPAASAAPAPSTTSDSSVPATEVSTTTVPATIAPTTAAPTTTAPGPGPEPTAALVEVARADQPVDLAVRPGDPALYVVERAGRVRPLRDGELGPPVLDMTALTRAGGERGLLGLAFSPDGSLAYVNYTDRAGDTVVAEHPVGADGTFGTARVLLTIAQPYANHNGGGMATGPDGLLYIGTGDGGSQGDPQRRALDVRQLLGKMLRIDPTPSATAAYTIPADNPFLAVAGARPELWSLGLRNPWRFSFDRDTGDLWIADVGASAVEEVDVAWADEGGGGGLSFGWSAFEGDERRNTDMPAEGHTPPFYTYPHGDLGCSISGGARYRGTALAALGGWYVFSDYCSTLVRALEVQPDRTLGRVVTLAQAGGQVSAVREGTGGELYVLRLDGPILQVVPAG
jgi:glucose/arabinose dehydrogenase